jgi:hypothetical protein
MKNLLIVLIIFFALKANAQTYKIYTKGSVSDEGNLHQTSNVTQKGKGDIVLMKLNDTLYYTENALFVCGDKLKVGFPDYDQVLNNIGIRNWCTSNFVKYFPNQYFCLTIIANGLTPNLVPRLSEWSKKRSNGIGMFGDWGSRDFDIYSYNIGGTEGETYFGTGWLAVFDHEIGHSFGVYVEPETGYHWPDNSTVHGQMGGFHFPLPDYSVARFLTGDPVSGFKWNEIDNLLRNETEIFSENQLYLMGLSSIYPEFYQLENYKDETNGTVTYTNYKKYDREILVQKYGERLPSYIDSPKKFNMGFIYLAHDLAEINNRYEYIEKDIRYFSYSDSINTIDYRFLIPFLVETKMRASANARIANLDGNIPPQVTVAQKYLLMYKNTTQNIPFSYHDPENSTVKISVFGEYASVSNSNIVLGPFPNAGTYFYTISVKDAEGKMDFDHFVVDVHDPISTNVEVLDSYSIIRLNRNYPNPFTNLTRIEFNIPEPSHVELTVYNFQGIKIASLLNVPLEPGLHSVDWVPPNFLKGGIYYYQLREDGIILSHKMLLIK